MRFQRGQRFGWEICKWISQTGFINEETESFYFILKSEIIKKNCIYWIFDWCPEAIKK